MSRLLSTLLNIIIFLITSNLSQSDQDATTTTLFPTSSPTKALPFIPINNCSVLFPTINTSFNVCPLKLPNGFGSTPYYQVKDYRYDGINEKNETATYIYQFNVGASVLSQTPECSVSNMTSNPGYCTDISTNGGSYQCNEDLTPINGVAWAYQLRISNTTTNTIDDCWRLSNNIGMIVNFASFTF